MEVLEAYERFDALSSFVPGLQKSSPHPESNSWLLHTPFSFVLRTGDPLWSLSSVLESTSVRSTHLCPTSSKVGLAEAREGKAEKLHHIFCFFLFFFLFFSSLRMLYSFRYSATWPGVVLDHHLPQTETSLGRAERDALVYGPKGKALGVSVQYYVRVAEHWKQILS